MKILIATPAYGETVTTTYFDAILWLREHFRERHPHIRFEHKFMSLAMLPFVRNFFASLVLNDPSFTHLLFVDADMGFAPSLIENMIAVDKPVVGCFCPQRRLDLERLYALRERIADSQLARLVAQDYVGAGSIVFAGGGNEKAGDTRSVDQLVVEGACLKVREAGTGIMLIKREVFERLKARFPELWCEHIEESYARFGLSGGVLQCFEPMPDERGLYAGEDVSFCRRWVEGCGGEIWSVATETVVHVGTEKFVGNYLAKLRHGFV
ncbi:MAG: hypothetical protein IRZ09_13560 [Variibacter sp.]|nr:hypothetical protein [Variibacter sp.]